jgi:CRP-like cAMP-binding protein
MELVTLRQRQMLTEPNWPIQHIYFIETGAASVFSRGKQPVEIAMVGRFGMIGLPVVLGTNKAPFRSAVQLSAQALRLSARNFCSAMAEHPRLSEVLLKYVQFRLIVEAQAVFCNTKHRLEQRLAQWLLKAHDCIDGDKITASHELLSRMLAVRRAGITRALGTMTEQGIIHNNRCCIEIIDREKLSESTCECYQFVRDEYRRLIPLTGCSLSTGTGC